MIGSMLDQPGPTCWDNLGQPSYSLPHEVRWALTVDRMGMIDVLIPIVVVLIDTNETLTTVEVGFLIVCIPSRLQRPP